MNLPNKLTILRILLVPFMIATLLIDFPLHFFVSGLIFGAASLTDFFDGKIARERNLITDFGKFADPLADKILVISCLVCFVAMKLCDPVLVIVVLFREFAITSIRLVAASGGKVIAANMWGKVKTVTQIIAIVAVFVFQFFLELCKVGLIPLTQATTDMIAPWLVVAGEVLLWISTIFAIISGVIYLKDNKDCIKER
ncbi:MAG: CDP-diacylglycerol--glycerol-3-phosphate 3-phosphatidyltransferase [Ruminococcaceae bacterium]|nr:CDP-diacylglycerol--glycerol-3-phosphate 3-phosphatidyltransferase [Oscillospiraceae bacterium]